MSLFSIPGNLGPFATGSVSQERRHQDIAHNLSGWRRWFVLFGL